MKIIRKYLILLSIIPSIVFSQTIDWNESILSKRGKIIIPASTSINLPTADDYIFGFFVYDQANNSYKNVGQADYIPGQKIRIPLSYDVTGVNGYKIGERFITIVKNKSSSEVYGVEFKYEKGKNSFSLNDSSFVTDVYSSTWSDFQTNSINYCKFDQFIIPIPYGIKTEIKYSNSMEVDSSGIYPVIKFAQMTPGSSYTFQIMEGNISYIKTLYPFVLNDFPVGSLNKIYTICPNDSVTIPEYELNSTLRRHPLGTHSFKVPVGKYYYSIMYQNGCNTIDTVMVKVNPVFPLDEINKLVEICNGDTALISEYNSDSTIWRGNHKNGNRKMSHEGIYVFPMMHFPSSCSVIDTVTLKFKPFPSEELNKKYSLCAGNLIEVPEFSYQGELERKRLDGGSFQIITEGEYLFSAKYLTTGCEMIDTIDVVPGTNCDAVRYPEVFNPVIDSGLVFSNEEEVSVYNVALVKVAHFKGPFIWNGNDNKGAVLPVGQYYIIHEDGSTNSVSLIY